MATRQQPAAPSATTVPAIFAVSALIIGAATWFGFPGLILIAPAIAFAAVSAPPAILTGKRDSSGLPTAASPGEASAVNRYRMWNELRLRSVMPSMDWLPGWPMRLWWFAALAAGMLAVAIPTPALDGWWWRALAGVSVFAAIVSVNGALRRWTAPDDPCDGPTAASLKEIAGTRGGTALFVLAGIAAASTFLGALVALDRLALAGILAPVAPWMVAAALALLVSSASLAIGVRNAALEKWRTMVRVRAEWEPRWQIAKLDPAPRLVDHAEFGTVQVDTFEAHPSLGAQAIYPLVGKITAGLGSGSRAAILESPDVDSQGQPIPGTKNSTRFRIATFISDQMPEVNDPSTPADQVALRIAAAFSWMADAEGYGRWVISGVSPLHSPEAEDTTAAWSVDFAAPDGPSAKDMRHGPMGTIGAFAGAEVLIDHRSNSVYIGSLTGGTTQFQDPSAEKAMRDLADTDVWNERWSNILKLGAVRPRPEHAVYAESTLGRAKLFRQPFVVQQGMDPLEFFKLEAKISTTLNAAPFVSVTGFAGNGDRPGERHPQAFTVTWSDQPVASNPDKLEPQTGDGPKWVLAGRINEAFDVARLARPEVVSARPLTVARSRGHVWEIKLRLHGGVTLADVRGAAQRIRQALGSEWLRVATSGDGIVVVAGVDTKAARGVKFAEPEKKQQDYIIALDWEQAFSDAKVIGQGGLLPVLTRTDVLPNNDQVQVLDFKLPTGTSRSLVREAIAKLSTTTGNSFIDVRESPDGADSVRMLVSRDNPLPDRAAFDWDAVDSAEGIPFATGIEGEPVEYDPVNNPHVLLAGVTGAGKSVLAQVYLYGALVKGAELYVIDPVKGGADFQFARDHAKAFASTPQEAQAVMKAVYAEVVRRKNVNAQAGVGSFMDLADPPPRIFVMIDEFTSLMGQDTVPPASDDPEAEMEREQIISSNRAKTDVGVYAGKIAREARSAGVHLLLGTQKLSAKMLDTIPGAGDLKDLSLDTILPVPISDRFPTGWARNDELELGDVLFTPFGTTTTIEGFSEVFESNDVYEVTFDDGQVVKAGGGHWWQVSDEASRRAHGRADGAHLSARARRAQAASLLADTMSGNEYMTARDLAAEIGCSEKIVEKVTDAAGVPRFTVDRISGELLPYVRARGSAPMSYAIDDVMAALNGSARWGAERLDGYRGRRMTCREIMHILDGAEPTASSAGNLGTALREAGVEGASVDRESWVYNALSALRAIAGQVSVESTLTERGELAPLERVVTTAEMAAMVTTERGRSNWAVRQAAAIPGRHAELTVDPYVLGAWLGDGCRGTGYITSAAVDSCTDEFGLTDKAHMTAQLSDAGYAPRELRCSEILIATTGLRAELRAMGVLRDKHIPAQYLRASVEQRIALLQGLMDTDGTVTASGQLVIAQTNETLALQILELVRSLGMKASWNSSVVGYVPQGQREKKMTSTSYSVSFRSDEPAFRLPRKLARQAERSTPRRGPWRSIVSIRKVATVPTRCIRVADNRHLFLVEGFLPTHNTNLARTLLGKTSSGDRMSALRDFVAAPELIGDIPKGRGLYEPLTSSAQAVQVWYAPQADLREQLLLRRPVLTAEQRLDVEGLLPKRPDESAAALRHFSETQQAQQEPDEIVLDEMEFSLDDLEVDDDVEIDAPDNPEGATMSNLIVVPSGFEQPGVLATPAFDSGLPGNTGWWKLDWLLANLAGATTVTWFDEQLGEEDEIGVPYAELAIDALSEVGVQLVVHATNPPVASPQPDASEAPELLLPAPTLAPAPAPAPEPIVATPAIPATVAPREDIFDAQPVRPRLIPNADEFPDKPTPARPGTVFDELF